MKIHLLAPLVSILLTGCGDRAQPSPSIATLLSDADLLHNDRAVMASELLRDTDFVLLYFSAHWCRPCRTFTPKLIDFYQKQGGGRRFELLFISNDRSEQEMKDYIQTFRMPWPAVRHRSPTATALAQHYSGKGIPRLVLITPQGQILADSYRGNTYIGPNGVLTELNQRLNTSPTASLPPPTKETIKNAPAPQDPAPYRLGAIATAGKRRVAIINDLSVVVGDQLTDGATVTEIAPDHVLLETKKGPVRLEPHRAADGS